MPKLAREFIAPRIKAYDIAIKSLGIECDRVNTSYAELVEFRFLIRKLKKEQEKFITKHGEGL